MHKYLTDISSLAVTYSIDNEIDFKITVKEATNRFNFIKDKYLVMKPLFDKANCKNLDEMLINENYMSEELIAYIYEEKKVNTKLKDLLLIRQKFEKELVKMAQNQIQSLLNI